MASIFRFLFRYEPVAKWILARDPAPETSLDLATMQECVITEYICSSLSDSPALASSPVQRGANAGWMGKHGTDPWIGVGDVVLVCHANGGDKTYKDDTDSVSISYLTFRDTKQGKDRSALVPCDGVHRAIGIMHHGSNMLVLASHCWLTDGKSMLSCSVYTTGFAARTNKKSCVERHVWLLNPFPEFRYPAQRDVLKSWVAQSVRATKGPMKMGNNNGEKRRNQTVVSAWDVLGEILERYEHGVCKYRAYGRDHANKSTWLSDFERRSTQALWMEGDANKHSEICQHYLDSLVPIIGKKLVAWGRVSWDFPSRPQSSSLPLTPPPPPPPPPPQQQQQQELPLRFVKAQPPKRSKIIGIKHSRSEDGGVEKQAIRSPALIKRSISFLLNPEPRAETNQPVNSGIQPALVNYSMPGLVPNSYASAPALAPGLAHQPYMPYCNAYFEAGEPLPLPLPPPQYHRHPYYQTNHPMPPLQTPNNYWHQYQPPPPRPPPTYDLHQAYCHPIQYYPHPSPHAQPMQRMYSNDNNNMEGYSQQHSQQYYQQHYQQHYQRPFPPEPMKEACAPWSTAADEPTKTVSSAPPAPPYFAPPPPDVANPRQQKSEPPILEHNLAKVKSNRGRRPSKTYVNILQSDGQPNDHQVLVCDYINHLDSMYWAPTTKETCRFCTLVFVRKYDLKRHVRGVHLVEREHVCEDCGSQFKRRQHLDTHMAQVHAKGSFLCEHCKREFTSEVNMRRHVQNMHEMKVMDASS